LEQQARRLLIKYSERFAENFAGQWLDSRSATQHPSSPLAWAMGKESQLVFSDILKNTQPVSSLMKPGFTYLNSTLANHYRISGTGSSDSMEKVSTDQRGGLLAQGNFLTHTATAADSHPIKRGIWVLDATLCRTLPPLMAATLDEISQVGQSIDPSKTIAEKMRLHRTASQRCNSCHSQIDPIGLALENFDKDGIFRTSYDGGSPVIADLDFYGGVVRNPYELASTIAPTNEFRNCVSRKLAAYFSARNPTSPTVCGEPEKYDRPLIEIVTDQAVRGVREGL
jgi:hypothetical protein